METSLQEKGLVDLSELVAVREMATWIVEHVDRVESNVDSRVKSVRSEVQMVDMWGD